MTSLITSAADPFQKDLDRAIATLSSADLYASAQVAAERYSDGPFTISFDAILPPIPLAAIEHDAPFCNVRSVRLASDAIACSLAWM